MRRQNRRFGRFFWIDFLFYCIVVHENYLYNIIVSEFVEGLPGGPVVDSALPNAGGLGSAPGQGTGFPHAAAKRLHATVKTEDLLQPRPGSQIKAMSQQINKYCFKR